MESTRSSYGQRHLRKKQRIRSVFRSYKFKKATVMTTKGLPHGMSAYGWKLRGRRKRWRNIVGTSSVNLGLPWKWSNGTGASMSADGKRMLTEPGIK